MDEKQIGCENLVSAKKVPQRQCVGCGEMKNKKEMIRILKTPEGTFTLDTTGRKKRTGSLPVPLHGVFPEGCKGQGSGALF